MRPGERIAADGTVVEGRAAVDSSAVTGESLHQDVAPGSPVFAGYDTRFIPLHVYFNRAMDLMYDHLKHGTPLPPSQVVRTVPRGGTPGAAPALTAANIPPISATPAAGDLITFDGAALRIPD